MYKLSIKWFFILGPFNNPALALPIESAYQHALIKTALHQIPQHSEEKKLAVITENKVTMTVFTRYADFKVGEMVTKDFIWATVAPEVKELCSQYAQSSIAHTSKKSLHYWITRLLGLPIKQASMRRFVELQLPATQAYYGENASLTGIFRPCTDPRIMPHEDNSAICPKLMNPNDPYIASEFKTWFINNSIASHTLREGYPWTKYGYTYNWNDKGKNPIGVSEFVIAKGTIILVLPNPNNPNTPYLSAEEYCGSI